MVTNAELDHHTTYGSLRDVLETFRPSPPARAHAVVPPELADAGEVYGPADVELAVPGEHNQLNAGAALAALRLAGVEFPPRRRCADFTGAGRRFERLGETASGAVVVDDYAHHPTEVAATIAAARTLGAAAAIVAVFQPHLFSRTQAEARGFGRGAGRRRPPGRHRHLPGPRAPGGLPGRHRACWSPRRRPTPRAPVVWMPTLEEAEAYLAAAPARRATSS